jgi:hypothetical protein
MEELVRALRAFLGRRAKDIEIKGPAEINITAAENEDVVALSAELQSHVVEIVDGNILAKINIIPSDGGEKDSFSLNQ